MRPTGRRSSTDAVGCQRRPAPFTTGPVASIRLLAVCVALVVVLLGCAVAPAQALDFFTLWKRPEIPLNMVEGAWAEYRTQSMSGGRRESGAVRIACLDRGQGSDDESFVVELLPLREISPGVCEPLEGQGTRLRLSRDILGRRGQLLDHVLEIRRWTDGVEEVVPVDEVREDPLLSSSLEAEFVPQRIERADPTTRVIGGRQWLCDQFTMSAADTQSARLPAGNMVQVSEWEISAAVNEAIPFLGLAFVTERVRAESHLDPPNRRMSLPPARVRVELMELVGFGMGAEAVLIPSD